MLTLIPKKNEQRASKRYKVSGVSVHIQRQKHFFFKNNTKFVSSTIDNISTGGFKFLSKTKYKKNERLNIRIITDNGIGLFSQVTVCYVHAQADGMMAYGVSFMGIDIEVLRKVREIYSSQIAAVAA